MRLFLISCLIVLGLFSCKEKAQRTTKLDSTLSKDTLWVDSIPYVELLDSTLDSTRYIKALADFAIQKLNFHSAEPYFDTSALFRGYNGRIRFNQGKLFSKDREKALVQIDDGDNLFLIFTKTGQWKLRQVIYANGRVSDSATSLYDYNFDGVNDLAIIWNYTAGRCSCSDPGCRNLYLFDDAKDSLILVPEVSEYLDFGISPSEQVLYLGEHCDGFYGKFKWYNGMLTKVEEYLIQERNVMDGIPSWTLVHNQFKDNERISTTRKNNSELPKAWKQIFKWTYGR